MSAWLLAIYAPWSSPKIDSDNQLQLVFFFYLGGLQYVRAFGNRHFDVRLINVITLPVFPAILVLFMVRALRYSADTATAIYHAFIVGCYLSPILGAMLSDGCLGKFRFSFFFVKYLTPDILSE